MNDYRVREMEVIEQASRVLGRSIAGEQPIETLLSLLNVISSKDELLEKRNEEIAYFKSRLDGIMNEPTEEVVPVKAIDIEKVRTALRIVEIGLATGNAELYATAQKYLLNYLSESKTDE